MNEILKSLRERAGLTVQAAADKLGVHRATIYAWEGTDGKIPEPEKLRAAMDAYGATDEERAKIAALRAFGPDPERTAAAS